ncbi:hypothetical protein MKW92_021281 [Papaver armeniacum]|nr:hypothetical protein MKW92_021281 [Papaver armeniacum]
MEEQAKEIVHLGLKFVCFQLFMVHIKQCRNICKKLNCIPFAVEPPIPSDMAALTKDAESNGEIVKLIEESSIRMEEVKFHFHYKVFDDPLLPDSDGGGEFSSMITRLCTQFREKEVARSLHLEEELHQ